MGRRRPRRCGRPPARLRRSSDADDLLRVTLDEVRHQSTIPPAMSADSPFLVSGSRGRERSPRLPSYQEGTPMTTRAVYLLLICVVASILYPTPVIARETSLIRLPLNAGIVTVEMNDEMQLYDQQIISVYTALDTRLSPGAGATVELRVIGPG